MKKLCAILLAALMPVTIPSNIEGGIGFVDVVNTAVVRIDLPSAEEVYREGQGDPTLP